jgi:hypothetical protein
MGVDGCGSASVSPKMEEIAKRDAKESIGVV